MREIIEDCSKAKKLLKKANEDILGVILIWVEIEEEHEYLLLLCEGLIEQSYFERSLGMSKYNSLS